MQEGRTSKVINNSKYAFYYKIVETVLAFLLRTVFINTLSSVYLGINGVFTNVLTMLSLMDLGVGAAISFSLYKPLALRDEGKIASLLNLYKRIYNSIGCLVCIIGFSLTPFLKYILTLPEELPEIYLIYWLNIGNTAITYFLAYKRTILIADQKAYIKYKYDILFKISRFILLSAILIFTHNFVLYLAFDILNTLVSNIFISIKVNQQYPFLKNAPIKPLEKDEKRKLVSFINAGFFNKIGQAVTNSTDNIIISAFVSTLIVGYYSNYVLIISGIETAVYLLFSNITSSVGNLAACSSNDLENANRVFNRLQFFCHNLSAVVFTCLLCLINPFIEIWIGKESLLPQSTVIIVLINLYITLSLNGVFNFMSAKGELAYKNRIRPILEAGINLIVSLLLVKYTTLGINGVFIGTTISFLCGRFWMDARVLYKYWLKISFRTYVFSYLKNVIITVFIGCVCFAITRVLLFYFALNIFVWILLCAVVLLISVGTILLIYRKNDNMIYFYNLLKKYLRIN